MRRHPVVSRTAEATSSNELAVVSQIKQKRIWLVAVMLFVLLRALPNITYPIGHDQAEHAMAPRGLLQNQQLSRDVLVLRPPGIFWTYAKIVKLFGAAMWSIGVVDIVWLLAISYCIFRFTERHLGAAAGFRIPSFIAALRFQKSVNSPGSLLIRKAQKCTTECSVCYPMTVRNAKKETLDKT
jgi:hypothetical protein